ncbi:hypothetical protein B0H17DRAFT_910696, partial [Mycena rosella]
MADPIPQFWHIISTLKSTHPKLMYLHLVEPRIAGDRDAAAVLGKVGESNDPLRALWSPGTCILAGGFDQERGTQAADADGSTLVVYGRHFVSN